MSLTFDDVQSSRRRDAGTSSPPAVEAFLFDRDEIFRFFVENRGYDRYGLSDRLSESGLNHHVPVAEGAKELLERSGSIRGVAGILDLSSSVWPERRWRLRGLAFNIAVLALHRCGGTAEEIKAQKALADYLRVARPYILNEEWPGESRGPADCRAAWSAGRALHTDLDGNRRRGAARWIVLQALSIEGTGGAIALMDIKRQIRRAIEHDLVSEERIVSQMEAWTEARHASPPVFRVPERF